MRIYRVHRTMEAGASAGYEHFARKRDADKAVRQWLAENPDEHSEVFEIHIQPTRAGIITALNVYASHNDNG